MRNKIFVAGIIIGLALVIFVLTNDPNVEVDDQEELIEEVPVDNSEEKNNQLNEQWSYEDYNIQFAEGPVLGILDSLIGENGRVAFYLPPTKYIQVSPGQSFGVAFALNNPEPSDGENYFIYSFTPSPTTVSECEVAPSVAQSWISMGQNSFGKIPKGWIDKMTVYFEFPENIEDCTARYNFEVTRDGQLYETEQLEFRIS